MRHVVVLNDEEMYSIWPADRALPDGWRRADFEGEMDDCLAYVERTWTDMRPLSLRRRREEEAAHTENAAPRPSGTCAR
jgi:MbtH protein